MKDSMTNVVRAMKIYEKNKETYYEKIIECYWLICTISEILSDNKMVIL